MWRMVSRRRSRRSSIESSAAGAPRVANIRRTSSARGGIMNKTLLYLLTAALIAGCTAETPTPDAANAAAPYHAVANVKQVMNWIIEPNADVLWDSVGTIITEAGREELMPKTEEEWEAVRNSAAVVAEAGNLLMM